MSKPQHNLVVACASVFGILGLVIGWTIPSDQATETPAGKAAPVLRVHEAQKLTGFAVPVPAARDKVPVLVRGAVEEEESISGRMARLLSEARNLENPVEKEALVAELRRLEELDAERTKAKAEELNLPLVTEHGSVLIGFQSDRPLYDISHNAGAAAGIGTDLVRGLPPYSPDGGGSTIGLWDVFFGPTTGHVDLPNVLLRDDAMAGGLHSSHVAGTLLGLGVDPAAMGMAPNAQLWSYSSTNVVSELASVAATSATDVSGLFVSAHPYGVASGWEYDGDAWYGSFSNDGDASNDVPVFLGQYSGESAAWDGVADSYPHHLIVKSSGNHRDDNAPDPGSFWTLNGGSGYTYDPASHPNSDGDHYALEGYGTVDTRGSSKNVLTVGSVSDALTDGARDPGAAVLSAFSSIGPTDDGRIKPDLVAPGEDIYSVDGNSTDRYLPASGTSMSTGVVAGSALLLQEIYQATKGQSMRSSSLKALLIHTADDLETPGPDYRTGWGLANVEAAADLLDDDSVNAGLKRLKQAKLETIDPSDAFPITVDGSGPLRVTLCWTDQAGSWTSSHDNRTARLINDLNLRLVGEDGTVYYPYVMPFTSTWAESDMSAPAQNGINTVDNVEQVYLAAPAAGLYRIEIDYAGVLQGPAQTYSLVVSGAYLQEEAVEVVTPVPNQKYTVEDTSPIRAVANADVVFSGSGHQYSVSWAPEGILTAEVDAAGDINLFPTATSYGQVALTVTAQDAIGGEAQTTFLVGILSDHLRVNSATPAVPGTEHGGSWDFAFANLQDALELALPGQEIWVANGVYYPDTRSNGDSDARGDSFVIPDEVGVYGGFSGFETARSQRNPNSGMTILSGDINQDDSQQPIASNLSPLAGTANNSYHVVRVPQSAEVTVDGFVITAGCASAFLESDGGGLLAEDQSSLYIENCLFVGNNANGLGGGAACKGARVEFVRCKFLGNKASSGGGALASEGSDTSLAHSEIRGNEAPDGGAIYLEYQNLWITDCVISGNKGFFGAGGIHMVHGWFQMVNSVLTGNSTLGQGGAIRISNSQGRSWIQNSIIWANLGGGSQQSSTASIYCSFANKRPWTAESIVANSGGTSGWNGSAGVDGGGNLDLDPGFVVGVAPGNATAAGDFRLTGGSPAINRGDDYHMWTDYYDLDDDGVLSELTPLDLDGNQRIVSALVDMGPYEFNDLGMVDGDGDGLSDEFEQMYGGGDLDPNSDDDGDGMTALAEFVHGLDPNKPLEGPVATYEQMEDGGSQYLCMTFLVNPDALAFVNITIERRGSLDNPNGWLENQTLPIAEVPSVTHPGLVEVTYRSLVPFGQDKMEFLRVRHDVIPDNTTTIPQGDLRAVEGVSSWNAWVP